MRSEGHLIADLRLATEADVVTGRCGQPIRFSISPVPWIDNEPTFNAS